MVTCLLHEHNVLECKSHNCHSTDHLKQRRWPNFVNLTSVPLLQPPSYFGFVYQYQLILFSLLLSLLVLVVVVLFQVSHNSVSLGSWKHVIRLRISVSKIWGV